jgi:hypothetical protein
MDGKTINERVEEVVALISGDETILRMFGELVRGAFRDGAVAALESIQELAVEEQPLESLTWEHLARLCQYAIDTVNAIGEREAAATS